MALIKFERVVKISASVGDEFVGRFPVVKADELPKKVEHARRMGRTFGKREDATLSFSLERKVVVPIFGPITYRREKLGSGDEGLERAQAAFLDIPKSRRSRVS